MAGLVERRLKTARTHVALEVTHDRSAVVRALLRPPSGEAAASFDLRPTYLAEGACVTGARRRRIVVAGFLRGGRMTAGPSTAPSDADAGWDPAPPARAFHIAIDLVLDMLRASQGPLSAFDALIRAAVVQANIAAATTPPEGQAAYARLEDVPPDDLRRPVSISRLAQGLGLPFETVRRHVGGLCERGYCQMLPRGVVVPMAYFLGEESQAAVQALDLLCAATHGRLVREGFFEDRPLPETAAGDEEPPARAVARLATDFSLRFSQSVRGVWGDNLDVLLLMQMLRLNAAEPATVSRIADDLGVKFETARRRLIKLAGQGLCVHVSGGYLIAEDTVASLPRELLQDNEMNLWRLYRGCAQVGALQAWRARANPAR